MGKLIDVDKFLKKVKKDREHEIYLHSWTADMVLERLDSWYAPSVEAIPKDQYEARLKADMLAMLTELQSEIEELKVNTTITQTEFSNDSPARFYNKGIRMSTTKIQQKIDALKESEDEIDKSNK